MLAAHQRKSERLKNIYVWTVTVYYRSSTQYFNSNNILIRSLFCLSANLLKLGASKCCGFSWTITYSHYLVVYERRSRGTTKRGYYVWKPLRGGYLRVTAVSHQSPGRHLTSHTSSLPPSGREITTNRRFCIVYSNFL